MAAEESQHAVSPRLEKALSYVVLTGIIISVTIFLIGLIYAAATSSIDDSNQAISLSSIAGSIASLDPIGILGIGVIAVILTPIIRVISTIIYFSGADRRLVILPIVTLVLIIAGFFLRV